MKSMIRLTVLYVLLHLSLTAATWSAPEQPIALASGDEPAPSTERRLYVAVPGIRDYLEYGGHGLLVYDIDHQHRFVKRIPIRGLDQKGKPLNVKGICTSASTKRIYVSTTKQLMCIDLVNEKLLWEKSYDLGCDRMAITPDGSRIFLPSFEGPIWYVVGATDGEVIGRITPDSGSHNTVVGSSGKAAYLAGLKSPFLTVADTQSLDVTTKVGPFSASIRPFTVNGRETLCFVNINELLGFEVGDLTTGKKLYRVQVQGFGTGPTKRHGCPSHGIALTPDEKELWLADAFNSRIHIFDATVAPPKQLAAVTLRDQPGWITFSIDGRFGYPSTGEVIDVQLRRIVSTLKDENGSAVHSEKMVEVDFSGGGPVRTGDQFGLGRVTMAEDKSGNIRP
jgi:DNA-binding beta-propeller fold protein YncE